MDFLAAVAGNSSGMIGRRILPTPMTGTSNTGETITLADCLKIPAFWRALAIKAGQFSMIPLTLKKRVKGGGTEDATDHPLYKLVVQRPNQWQNAFIWKKHSYTHTFAYGNSYNFIERQNDGVITALVPLTTARIKVVQDQQGTVAYEYTNPISGVNEIIPKHYIMHWVGEQTVDGIVGLSLIDYIANCMALGKKQAQYSEYMLDNRAMASAVVTFDEKLSDAAYQRLKADIRAFYQGTENAGSVPILDNGGNWNTISTKPADMQLDSERNHFVSEISRFSGVPEHMLGQNEHSTYDNVYQLKQEFLDFTLAHDLSNTKANMNDKLLTDKEKEKYFFDFDTKAYIRMDPEEQRDFLKDLRNMGVFNGDEIRKELGYDQIEDGSGKMYWRPGNMVPADTPVAAVSAPGEAAGTPAETPKDAPKDPEKAKKIAQKEDKKGAKRAATRLFEDVLTRIDTRIGNIAERVRKRKPGLEERSKEMSAALLEQKESIVEMLMPVSLAVVEQFGEIDDLLDKEVRSVSEFLVTQHMKRFIEGLEGSGNSPAVNFSEEAWQKLTQKVEAHHG